MTAAAWCVFSLPVVLMPVFSDSHNVVAAPAVIGLISTTVQFGENEAQTALARDDHLLDAIYCHKGQQFSRTTACAVLIWHRSIYIQNAKYLLYGFK